MLSSLVLFLLVPPVSVDSSSHSDTSVCHSVIGTTLAARVPRCWQLSSVPRPLDLSSYAFNNRVLGRRLWIIQHPSLCRLEAVWVPSPLSLGSADACPSPQPAPTALQLHQRHLPPKPEAWRETYPPNVYGPIFEAHYPSKHDGDIDAAVVLIGSPEPQRPPPPVAAKDAVLVDATKRHLSIFSLSLNCPLNIGTTGILHALLQ